MEPLELQNTELSGIEKQLNQQLSHITPDGSFVEELRTRLMSSGIFEKRSMIDTIVVACLAIILTGSLILGISRFFHLKKKKG